MYKIITGLLLVLLSSCASTPKLDLHNVLRNDTKAYWSITDKSMPQACIGTDDGERTCTTMPLSIMKQWVRLMFQGTQAVQ